MYDAPNTNLAELQMAEMQAARNAVEAQVAEKVEGRDSELPYPDYQMPDYEVKGCCLVLDVDSVDAHTGEGTVTTNMRHMYFDPVKGQVEVLPRNKLPIKGIKVAGDGTYTIRAGNVYKLILTLANPDYQFDLLDGEGNRVPLKSDLIKEEMERNWATMGKNFIERNKISGGFAAQQK